MSKIPADLRYAESHEWVKLEGDTAVVGITAFAVEQLGDIVGLAFNARKGDKLKAGTSVAEVESVKAASDIYSPVAGELVAVNDDAAKDPEAFARDPYAKGWLFKVKGAAKADVEKLLSADAYAKHTAGH